MEIVEQLGAGQNEALLQKIDALAPFLGELTDMQLINEAHLTLFTFSNGYALTSGQRILEIGAQSPYSKNSTTKKYYLGPLNYFEEHNGKLIDCLTQEKVQLSKSTVTQFHLREKLAGFSEFGKNLITPTPKVPPKLSFTGIEPEKFAPYQTIKTTKGYLCGSIAASVLLSYLQDNQGFILPTTLRRPNARQSDALSAQLIHFLQPVDFPTLPVQLAAGLRRFFHHYRIPTKINWQSIGARAHFERLCEKDQPAIIGVLRYFGSSYGNHWVTAYAYAKNEMQTFYRIHDNWGDAQKIIASTWGNGLITVAKKG